MPKVHVVVVAYNRRALLETALVAVLGQIRPAECVHVIDNASDDGTSAMVRERFPTVDLHSLPVNTGGAGGFAAGIAVAAEAGADLVWLMDDDTVPHDTALQQLLRARSDTVGETPDLLASRVVWIDGRDHPMNTPRERPGVRAEERASAAGVGCIAVRSASFVSVLVSVAAIRAVGLPQAEFFLWNDDFEFTTRLLRHRRGLYCPASVVEHRTRRFGSTDLDPGERFYFEVRNKVWTFLRSDGLSPQEKVLYSGSTLRRWARTFRSSRERAVLRSGLARGLRDGLLRKPRDPVLVLSAAGVVVSDPRTPEHGAS